MVGRNTLSRESVIQNVRVMAVAENELGALLLREVLGRFSGCEVVRTMTTCEEALTTAASNPPDVAVINQDLEGEALRGLHLTGLLASASSRIKPVVIVGSRSREMIAEAFQSGARGIFHHGETIDALWQCICEVHQGQIYASQSDICCLVETLLESPPLRLLNAQGRAILTKKEQVVANYVTEGYTNREIAERLQLSEHTVKNYLFRIFDRLGVSSRAEMIFYVLSRRTHPSEQEIVPADNKLSFNDSSLSANFKRAHEGYGIAQYRLGELYDLGQGVPEDSVASYMWLTIAETTAAFLLEAARTARNRVASRMPSADIAAAQTRATKWRSKHGEGSYEYKHFAIGHTESAGALNLPSEAHTDDKEKLPIPIAADA